LHEIGGKPLLAHVIAAAGKLVAPSENLRRHRSSSRKGARRRRCHGSAFR
jgi:bifunctional N-acetylglucosamine-1-phosphate-uridyltransferase/glucosamine-1-phosphate-acetyltransferase GlmU-like protein